MMAWSWHQLVRECGGDEEAALARLSQQTGWGEHGNPDVKNRQPYSACHNHVALVEAPDVAVHGPDPEMPWLMEERNWTHMTTRAAWDLLTQAARADRGDVGLMARRQARPVTR